MELPTDSPDLKPSGSYEDFMQRYSICGTDVDIDTGKNAIVLGGGKSGKVYRGLYRGAQAAFKHVSDVAHYMNEKELFNRVCNHPNICRFFGFHSFKGQNFIVTHQ